MDINEVEHIFNDLKRKRSKSYWYERALYMNKGFEPEEDEDLSPDEEMETTKS